MESLLEIEDVLKSNDMSNIEEEDNSSSSFVSDAFNKGELDDDKEELEAEEELNVSEPVSEPVLLFQACFLFNLLFDCSSTCPVPFFF